VDHRKIEVTFLDEFRMAILPDESTITELVVFNTLIPQYQPGNLRRLEMPQHFHSQRTKVHIDHDRPLGTPDKDEPFITDPAQGVIVVELMRGWDRNVFFVIRTQALIEHTCSTPAGPRVPWDEWWRDVVVMEVLAWDCTPYAFVHGAQVVVMWSHVTTSQARLRGRAYYGVHILDFSQRGQFTDASGWRGWWIRGDR